MGISQKDIFDIGKSERARERNANFFLFRKYELAISEEKKILKI